MSRPRIAGLLPMRDQSERVPGKNYRPFAERPLYHQVLRTLLDCPYLDQIVIDTDSPTILADARAHFPTVNVIERPPDLRDGTIPMNDVLLHDVEQVESDLYLQTHSTNPLLRAETLSRAIRHFLERRDEFDSMFSVTRIHTRLWDVDGRAVNHDPDVLLRTQDLPPIFEENSCFFLFGAETLRRRRNRIGDRPLMFEIDREEAWDIDEELDFAVAEFLFRRRGGTE